MSWDLQVEEEEFSLLHFDNYLLRCKLYAGWAWSLGGKQSTIAALINLIQHVEATV